MIRKALEKDVPAAAANYRELLTYEKENGTNSKWVLDLYPTRETAEKAWQAGTLYVLEEDGEICGSVILNQLQPAEYGPAPWHIPAAPEEVLVIHTLCIPPSRAGHGYGKQFVQFALALAAQQGCKAVRLDTWAGNKPAAALYTKMGFAYVGRANVLLQGVIPEEQIFFDHAVEAES